MTPALIHRTCSHHAAAIAADGFVKPMPQPAGSDLSWWSDLTGQDETIRAALGLTSLTLSCDRMEHGFVSLAPTRRLFLRPWTAARLGYIAWPWLQELGEAPGAMPAHWWVATHPVAVSSMSADDPQGAEIPCL